MITIDFGRLKKTVLQIGTTKTFWPQYITPATGEGWFRYFSIFWISFELMKYELTECFYWTTDKSCGIFSAQVNPYDAFERDGKRYELESLTAQTAQPNGESP
jgi:hypothetical protein